MHWFQNETSRFHDDLHDLQAKEKYGNFLHADITSVTLAYLLVDDVVLTQSLFMQMCLGR